MSNSKQKRLKKIGENLKIYREASGRSIDVVANTLGVDVAFLKSVERGYGELDFVQYVGIAEMYNIGFSNIFEAEADKSFYCPKIPARIIEFIVQKANEYCKQKRITKKQLFERLGTNSSSYVHFTTGYCLPTPQRVENMIALFGLTHATLKGVMCEAKKPQQEEQKVEEPSKPVDAMTLVTEALDYYKNKEKHIAALTKIISEAQELIKELGGAV